MYTPTAEQELRDIDGLKLTLSHESKEEITIENRVRKQLRDIALVKGQEDRNEYGLYAGFVECQDVSDILLLEVDVGPQVEADPLESVQLCNPTLLCYQQRT
jgi:hypothetical protein